MTHTRSGRQPPPRERHRQPATTTRGGGYNAATGRRTVCPPGRSYPNTPPHTRIAPQLQATGGRRSGCCQRTAATRRGRSTGTVTDRQHKAGTASAARTQGIQTTHGARAGARRGPAGGDGSSGDGGGNAHALRVVGWRDESAPHARRGRRRCCCRSAPRSGHRGQNTSPRARRRGRRAPRLPLRGQAQRFAGDTAIRPRSRGRVRRRRTPPDTTIRHTESRSRASRLSVFL
jgi:hypothetical protein